MTLGQQEELRAGEERVVGRDARLIRREDVRQVIELDGDARDPLRIDSPRLLTDLRGPQLVEKVADELGMMFRRPQA